MLQCAALSAAAFSVDTTRGALDAVAGTSNAGRAGMRGSSSEALNELQPGQPAACAVTRSASMSETSPSAIAESASRQIEQSMCW